MISKKDLKIVAYLRNDARIGFTSLSRKTGIPVSTIFDRLRATENSLITKHTSLLDFAKLGYHTRANINLKVDRDDKKALEEHLIKHPSINTVCKINNGYDYMIEGVFKQIMDMEEFLDQLESKFKILDKKSYFIIEDLKKEAFLTDPDLLLIE